MSEKILFVDDDPSLLSACERNFRKQFPLDTAEGGETGLRKIAEQELLNKTLSGSIKMLTDILATVDTKSFERSDKLRGLISEAITKIPVENAWEVHLAAMLSPIGYLTLPAETMVKARTGQMLSKAEE